MSKKGGKAPKAPNPMQTASAQTGLNIGTAVANNALNQVNQVTPDGSLTYSQTGTTKWTDPNTGKVYNIPQYTATQALSGAQGQIKSESDAAEFNLASAANRMSGNINTSPFNVNDEVEKRIFDLGSKRLAPRLDMERRRAETDAANRGLRLGSDAYDRLMRGVGENENDAYNQLALTGRAQAYSEADTDYNRDINRISALLSGSQVSQPNFVNTPQSNIANTDYAGLVNAGYQQKLDAWKAKQESNAAMLGGLFGMGGKLGAAAIQFSDRRLKTDIKKVGETGDGQNIYSYRYKGGKGMRLGLMAQEVEKKKPEAVLEHPSGFKMVDYGKALEAA